MPQYIDYVNKKRDRLRMAMTACLYRSFYLSYHISIDDRIFFIYFVRFINFNLS